MKRLRVIKNKIWISFLAFLTILNYSCEKELDNPSINIDRKIVAYAEFSVNEKPRIKLYHSRLMTDNRNSSAILNNAQIKIFENDQLKGIYTPSIDGYCIPDFNVLPKSNYNIEISSNSYNTISGKTNTSQPIFIIPKEIVPSRIYVNEFLTNCYKYTLELNDPADTDNYYLIDISSNYTFEYGSFKMLADNINVQSENIINEKMMLINDKLFAGKKHNLILYSDRLYNYNNTEIKLKVRISEISEALYQYLWTYNKMSEYDGPFSEAVTDYTNITNGYGIIYSKYNQVFEFVIKPN